MHWHPAWQEPHACPRADFLSALKNVPLRNKHKMNTRFQTVIDAMKKRNQVLRENIREG